MKKIEAIIRHHKLEDVKRALDEAGVLHGMTIAEVRGSGLEESRPGMYRGAAYRPTFIPKIKLEILADEQDTSAVVDCIYDAAFTGEIGDGKILVSTLDSVYGIRTGEALY